MTTELQRAMADYEEARIRYRKAVLASLAGASSGKAIERSIREFKQASDRLKAIEQRRQPPRARPHAPSEPTGWGLMRRLLRVG